MCSLENTNLVTFSNTYEEYSVTKLYKILLNYEEIFIVSVGMFITNHSGFPDSCALEMKIHVSFQHFTYEEYSVTKLY